VKWLQYKFNIDFPFVQDSFELPRRDSSRDADIEMGMHQADASDNLKGFLKKVLFT
jgi:hypothetical protein